jgi:hypothetical protein
MEVPMQSAGRPNIGRGAAEHSPRTPAVNRTLQWFSGDAEQRRRRSMPAARQARWRRSELFGCIALAALVGAMIGTPSFNRSIHPCRTEPGVLGSGAELAAAMTVSHNSACAIWTKLQSSSITDVRIEALPQHGTLALRGRTGVTYRPAPQFTGEDSFAFTLHGRLDVRDNSSLVRVRVTVH